jgi:uncharacterized Zn finger protein
MVHYGQLDFSQLANPECSRCGSRKTEVVGRLDDGRTLILRCNACGAHTTLITPDSERSNRTVVTVPSKRLAS